MKPKLVRDRKVQKLSREKSTVKAALQRALDDSHKEGWKTVFIVGGSKETGYRTRHTATPDIELLGLIEIGKSIIYKDV